MSSLLTSIRGRRLATSTFFLATFCASIFTVAVSANTILPCPAKKRGGAMAEGGALVDDNDDDDEGQQQRQSSSTPRHLPMNGVGQRVLLTRKGGWIEIEPPAAAGKK